jgi:hypothetical protein
MQYPQNPNVIFHRNRKKVLKSYGNKRSQIAKRILSKISNTGGITILDFKLYYRDLVTETEWSWHISS